MATNRILSTSLICQLLEGVYFLNKFESDRQLRGGKFSQINNITIALNFTSDLMLINAILPYLFIDPLQPRNSIYYLGFSNLLPSVIYTDQVTNLDQNIQASALVYSAASTLELSGDIQDSPYSGVNTFIDPIKKSITINAVIAFNCVIDTDGILKILPL